MPLKSALIALCFLALAGCAGLTSETPRTYLVFFTYDSAMLSPEARGVVHEAADAAKSLKPMRVELAGYTGREDDPRTTAPLADARYQTVEAALAAEGIDRSLFSRNAVIDEVPLPATAARRIEIRLIGN